MANIDTLRQWLSDGTKEIFSDADLTMILTRNGAIAAGADVAMTPKMLDYSRADAYEIIAGDVKRWNSYSIGGVSETISKMELQELAKRLRSKWIAYAGDIEPDEEET